MRRKASKLVLISAGAALAWFLDPVSGRDRRQQVLDQVDGLRGKTATPGSDPTGGATPPAVDTMQPGGPLGMAGGGSSPGVDEAALAQAVEAASGGEKVLSTPGPGGDDADQNRTTLRATW